MITATQKAETPRSITSREIVGALRRAPSEAYRLHTNTYTCVPSVQRSRSSVGDSSRDIAVPTGWCGEDSWRSWIYLSVITDTPVSVEHSILVHYLRVDQVQAIYVQNLPNVSNVFVLLKQDHYDDALMDSLLDLEAEILDLYPDRLFEFHYMPLLVDRQILPVPASAILILYRQH